MTSAARSGAASGLRDAKVYRGGTHRSRRPEDTLAAILPLAERMGITRLANVTGLDRIGIPVCMACRPLSRSLAVSQGKGLTLAEAKRPAMLRPLPRR